MDAHVFRRLCDALSVKLDGARMEKIQSPASGVHFFSFYNIRGPFQLVIRAERKAPFLFIPAERLSAGGGMPPAEVMRLRKYLVGLRVAACMADWPARRLNILFRSPPEQKSEIWLVLDLREGPKLLLGRSPDMPDAPLWPDLEQIEAARDNSDALRKWSVITPALRRIIPHLDRMDLAALLNDLAEGGGDLFLYQSVEHEDDVLVSAWPLPEELRGEREEKIFEEPLPAMAEAGIKLVMGGLAEIARKKEQAPIVRAKAKFERILGKLDEEDARLRKMLAGKESGILLRDNLWRLDAAQKKSEVTLKTPGNTACKLSLDPRLTVLENMEQFFHQAVRGSRGLSFVAKRREKVAAEMTAAGLTSSVAHAPRAEQGAAVAKQCSGVTARPISNTTAAAVISDAADMASLPRGVAGFKSSDGRFTLWRGKDAKGNAALMKAAAPHDVWLHVDGGPGAHVLIRRDHAGQEIPEEIWREAGLKAAEKSWRKDDSKASVICALGRHVRPVKGGEPGAARVDKILRVLQVDMSDNKQ